MQKLINRSLVHEEQKTVTWFISLCLIISLSFDLFSDFIAPMVTPSYATDSVDLLGYWIYIILFGLVPVAFILIKRNKPFVIKYLYFFSYVFLTLVNDVIIFFDRPNDFKSGNAVEIFWLLLAPIFVNSRFFFAILGGLITKYLLLGLILKTTNVLFAILMVVIIGGFCYIILNRFQSYVNAVKFSYDSQIVGMVKGVIATLELKDPYTRGHSERVASYALLMAKKIGKQSKDELRSFHYACLLHDIGKVHIPDQILMKPTSLTKEEYEIIKSHPVVGEQAIATVEGLSSSIAVIRSHHERWDGKGYPDQLKGEEIPYLARIAAIADAFDAMTSSRSYRSALSVEEAYDRILNGKGTQFDPNLVEVFESIYPEWIEIHRKWNADPHTKPFQNLSII
ncbi:HD-GYP domain-containing protein [Bacillus sp. EB01]|uniref:HD-GYP domain-containing protein n=1 Tax=Bacillus sp. EB01 TaxID=1347086 RepID=UPI0005C491D1|nr:HD-GYP domain-containing protein [Bacillus sp. EB01]